MADADPEAASRPWSYIGHDETDWWAILSANCHDHPTKKQAASWRKVIAKETGKWIASGLRVTTCFSREEHNQVLDRLTMGMGSRRNDHEI